ncbi:bud22 domain-containing [Trichoderma arundinaceum]|uniref:Bud22 domain-containing n=1 Tax=Trichoderma arundinaceum TaxID=490622 RepID=A0A395NHG0_TRIAR|nr:bud22 domain-containing [Trichoderma arundinaceum]
MAFNPIVALSGKFKINDQLITQARVQARLQEVGITTYTSKTVLEEKKTDWNVLVVGNETVTTDAIKVAQQKKVPILNSKWAEDCLQSKGAVEIKTEYLWNQEYNPEFKNKTPQQTEDEKKKEEEEKRKEETRRKEEEEKRNKEKEEKKQNEEQGSGRNEGNGGKDSTEGDEDDVFDNVKEEKKRRNYPMWIECIYSYNFVVTDPNTPIFVDLPQFRDAYLIPARSYPDIKSQYLAAGGHIMGKQNSSTFYDCPLDKFELWQVAYDDRVCLLFGMIPPKPKPKGTDENGNDNTTTDTAMNDGIAETKPAKPVLGMWTRSEVQMAYGTKEADEFLNRAFLALGHGDGEEDREGRLTNGALKKWKKSRTRPSDGLGKERYQLRGTKAKLEPGLP